MYVLALLVGLGGCNALVGLSTLEAVDDAATGSSDAFDAADVPATETASDAALDVVAEVSDVAKDGSAPCSPDPTSGTVCLRAAFDPIPPYTSSAGAGSVGADGLGRMRLHLYATEPVLGSTPVYKYQYPADGAPERTSAELAEAAFPVPAGVYFAVVYFADAASPLDSAPRPGDLALPPASEGRLGTMKYPSVTASAGKVTALSVKLKPVRRFELTVSLTDPALAASRTNPSIHADGPLFFAPFDPGVGVADRYLEQAFSACVNVGLKGVLPAGPKLVTVPTTVFGAHSMLVWLLDYGATPLSGGIPRGAITMLGAASFTIDSASWISSQTVALANVHDPYGSVGVVDYYTCK